MKNNFDKNYAEKYFYYLESLGLPKVLKRNGEIVYIRSIIRNNRQFFISLENDTKFYHGSEFRKLNELEIRSLLRNNIIKIILDNGKS